MGRFFGIVLAIFVAVLLHAGFILFGGLLFPKAEDKGRTHEVELLSEAEADKKEKDKEKDPDPTPEKKEDMEVETEEVPDASEVIRSLEVSAAAAAPELEAVSLSAIDQALSGQGAAGGEFADSLSFASGGRIGGRGKAGTLDEKLDSAFSLAEIDQKPRAIFQAQPTYPTEMRGKKVEGVVTLIFIVDPAGKVSHPKVEKSTHPAFEKPALDAVRQWKFEAGVRGGQRVGCRMRVPIRFQPS